MQRIYYTIVLTVFINALQAQPVNKNISNNIYFDGEPSIAINPQNPSNLIVAWMGVSGGKGVSIKYLNTSNSGKTWSSINQMPHFSSGFHSADVSMAWNNNGTVYMSYIDYRQSPDSGGVYLLKSADGGTSWGSSVKVWDAYEDGNKRPIDRPWLEIDNSQGASNGRLYMTTKPAPWVPAPNRPYLKTSTPGGSSWGNFKYVDTTGNFVGNQIQAPMASVAVSANSTSFAIYPSYLASQNPYPRIILAKSKNQGASFTYHDCILNPTSVKDTNYKSAYKLVCNPNNPNQLAVAFVDNRNSDPDIFVTASNDEGMTWTAPVRVNDDSLNNGKAQDLVWLTYNNNNKLIVTWRDRRNASGTGPTEPSEIYFSVSKDNGLSFSKNARISDASAPFDPLLSQPGNDFMSACAYNDTLYATWGDMRSSKLNIYFAKVDVNKATSSIQTLSSETFPGLKVFPNPAQKLIIAEFYLPETLNYNVYIVDINGKKVYDQSRPLSNASLIKEPIDVSFLPAGSYILTIKHAEGKFSSHFLIER